MRTPSQKDAKRRAQGRERIRHWEARQQEQQACFARQRVPELDDECDVLEEKWSAVETRILEAPPTTAAGLAAKLRVALFVHGEAAEQPFNELEWTEKFLVTATRDAERLAGAS